MQFNPGLRSRRTCIVVVLKSLSSVELSGRQDLISSIVRLSYHHYSLSFLHGTRFYDGDLKFRYLFVLRWSSTYIVSHSHMGPCFPFIYVIYVDSACIAHTH